MSRSRITAKLRSQAWFAAIIAYLDAERVKWSVIAGTNHPKLTISVDGIGSRTFSIPCTPRPNSPGVAMYLTRTKAELALLRSGVTGISTEPGEPRNVSGWAPERIALLTRGVDPMRDGVKA